MLAKVLRVIRLSTRKTYSLNTTYDATKRLCRNSKK